MNFRIYFGWVAGLAMSAAVAWGAASTNVPGSSGMGSGSMTTNRPGSSGMGSGTGSTNSPGSSGGTGGQVPANYSYVLVSTNGTVLFPQLIRANGAGLTNLAGTNLTSGSVDYTRFNQNGMKSYLSSTIFPSSLTYASYALEQSPVGANINNWVGYAGGSAAAVRDLPVSGTAIWKQQPLPSVHLACFWDVFNAGRPRGGLEDQTAVYWTNAVNFFATNGLMEAWREFGVRPFAHMDAGWQSIARDGQNRLQLDPVRFPAGLTNMVSWFHTNGVAVMLGNYFVNVETNSGGPAGSYAADFPATTLGTVRTDIRDAYRAGVDSMCFGDMSPPHAPGVGDEMGYQQQMIRVLNYEAMNPEGFFWKRRFPQRSGPMQIAAYTPADVPPFWPYEVTIHNFDQPQGDGTFNGVMTAARYTLTNLSWSIGPGHYTSVIMSGSLLQGFTASPDVAQTNRARLSLSMGAMFSGFQQWTTNYCFSWYVREATNRNFMRVQFDPLCRPAWCAVDNGSSSNSVWVKPLVDGYALAVVNQGSNAVNVDVAWSMLKAPSGYMTLEGPPYPLGDMTGVPLVAVDIWNRTNTGVSRTGFSTTVAGTNFVLFKIKRPESMPVGKAMRNSVNGVADQVVSVDWPVTYMRTLMCPPSQLSLVEWMLPKRLLSMTNCQVNMSFVTATSTTSAVSCEANIFASDCTRVAASVSANLAGLSGNAIQELVFRMGLPLVAGTSYPYGYLRLVLNSPSQYVGVMSDASTVYFWNND